MVWEDGADEGDFCKGVESTVTSDEGSIEGANDSFEEGLGSSLPRTTDGEYVGYEVLEEGFLDNGVGKDDGDIDGVFDGPGTGSREGINDGMGEEAASSVGRSE